MLRPLSIVLASFALAGALHAQTPIAGSLSDSTTGPLLSGTVYHASNISVAPGATLTVEAGAIVKFLNLGASFEVQGTLLCEGTLASPVIFTDVKDDTAGGDTNGDGPSSGVAGHWSYMRFYGSASASVLDFTEVRFGGRSGWGGIQLSGGAPTLRDCTIRDCENAGLDLGTNSSPIVERCHFANNGGSAVASGYFEHLAGFSACTADGNLGGDYQAIPGHGITTGVTVVADDLINGVGVLVGTPTLWAGGSLTLGPGVVLKMKTLASAWEIQGTLTCQGTAAAPVIITDIKDDSAGGDTNDDGPSSGTPGYWTYMRFYGTANASELDYTEVRFAGRAGWGGVVLNNSAPTLRDCVIRDSENQGMDLIMAAADVSQPIIERCHFADNGGPAVTNARFQNIGGFSNCTASGNAGGNSQTCSGQSVTGDVLVQADDLIGGAIVLTQGPSILAGNSLTLGAGVVVKMAANLLWDVRGGFSTQGTATQPVVLTTYADDEHAGDTNLNGPSTGVAGSWIGVWLQGVDAVNAIDGLLVRYAGANGFSSVIHYAAAAYTLSDSRVDHGATTGFELRNHSGEAHGLTAWNCAATGIELLGGTFDLRQATAVACGTGISRAAAFGGEVRDSIAWHNLTNDATGFGVGEWRYSNGLAGLAGFDGNLYLDPQFADEPSGDFGLLASSACIDAGDPTSPLDPDSTRADMGAVPFDHCAPTVYCTAKLNSCGTSPSISASGAMVAGASSGFLVRASNVPGGRMGILTYGNAGAIAAPFLGGLLCVKAPLWRSTPVLETQGTVGLCDGVLELDVAAFALGALGGKPTPWLSLAGQQVWCQYWGRDVTAGDVMLSDALTFRVCP